MSTNFFDEQICVVDGANQGAAEHTVLEQVTDRFLISIGCPPYHEMCRQLLLGDATDWKGDRAKLNDVVSGLRDAGRGIGSKVDRVILWDNRTRSYYHTINPNPHAESLSTWLSTAANHFAHLRDQATLTEEGTDGVESSQ